MMPLKNRKGLSMSVSTMNRPVLWQRKDITEALPECPLFALQAAQEARTPLQEYWGLG